MIEKEIPMGSLFNGFSRKQLLDSLRILSKLESWGKTPQDLRNFIARTGGSVEVTNASVGRVRLSRAEKKRLRAGPKAAQRKLGQRSE